MNFALWERLHGHLAILGLVLLLHPAVLLARGQVARARRVAAPAVTLLLLATVMGAAIYGEYRAEIKPVLRVTDPGRVPLFEVKEHLAWLAASLATGGALMLRSRAPEAEAGARTMIWAAIGCGGLAAGLGIWVAAA